MIGATEAEIITDRMVVSILNLRNVTKEAKGKTEAATDPVARAGPRHR